MYQSIVLSTNPSRVHLEGSGVNIMSYPQATNSRVLLSCLSLIPNKEASTAEANNILIERTISVFGPPEFIHPDERPEFENKIIFQV